MGLTVTGMVAVDSLITTVLNNGTVGDMFSYQLAGDVLALDIAAHLILAWVNVSTTEQNLSPHNYDAVYTGNMTTTDQISKGLVWALDLDGVNDLSWLADQAEFSFDDTGGPNGFTMNAWIQVVAHTDSQMILAKYDLTDGATTEEWAFFIDEDEYLSMMLLDDSVPDYESMQSDVALTTATWYMVTAVYDGAGGVNASAGITLYVDGVAVAATATDGAGNYVGMEDLSGVVRIGGSENGSGSNDNFWQGDIGIVSQSVTQLTADQVWELYIRTRGYYNQ